MNQKQHEGKAKSEPQVHSSAWLGRIKTWLTMTAITAGIILLIGGCVRIDYKVFKSKYPSAGVGSYIWHKMSK